MDCRPFKSAINKGQCPQVQSRPLIYYAEKKILVALPKMAKAVNSDELRAAFEKHVAETQGQVDRLVQVFKLVGERPKGKTCPAILGLVEEGEEVMEDFEDSPALDAGLLA